MVLILEHGFLFVRFGFYRHAVGGRTLSDYNTPAVGGRSHFVGLLPLAGAIRYIGSSSIHSKIADMTDILPQHKHMQNLTTQEPA